MFRERKLGSVKPVSFCSILLIYESVMALSSRLLVVLPLELVEMIPMRLPCLSTTAPPDAPFCDTTVPPTSITSIVSALNVKTSWTVVTALVTDRPWSMDRPPRNPAG